MSGVPGPAQPVVGDHQDEEERAEGRHPPVRGQLGLGQQHERQAVPLVVRVAHDARVGEEGQQHPVGGQQEEERPQSGEEVEVHRWCGRPCRAVPVVSCRAGRVASARPCRPGAGGAAPSPVPTPPPEATLSANLTLSEGTCTICGDSLLLPWGREAQPPVRSAGAPAERRAGSHGANARSRPSGPVERPGGGQAGRAGRRVAPGHRGAPGRQQRGVPGVNLIICSLDTLRADHLSCLGNGRGLTPNLDRIAWRASLFSQCYATDIPTQPSHTALFTGKFGINSGIVSHFHPAAYLPEETLWLPSLLRRNGYVDRCRRPPLRHEGLVHPRLRRLHAPAGAVALARLGHQRHRAAVGHRAPGHGLLPVPPLLGRPHPLRAAVALQGAVHPRDTAGRIDPDITDQARGPAQLPAVQAEPLRLPRRHAEPRLHRRPLRRRGRLPRLRDRAHLRAPRAGGSARGHHGRPLRRPRREHDRARRLVRPRRALRLGHPRARCCCGRPGGSRWSESDGHGHPGRRDARRSSRPWGCPRPRGSTAGRSSR